MVKWGSIAGVALRCVDSLGYNIRVLFVAMTHKRDVKHSCPIQFLSVVNSNLEGCRLLAN